MKQLTQFVSFVASHQQELLDQTMEHLWLTLVSLAIATTIGLSLGLFISKNKRFSSLVIGFVNAVQTIPSVALLGFLLPFLGIGVIPAIVALFLYALLPIVRNTYTGITEIDPAIREAAIGMGMSPFQVLMKVELPLAMPVLFAGIRTAFVINVGIATLCALIAAGGLGEFIFRGLSTNNPYMILAGAIPAALMALIFDSLMGLVQKHVYTLIKPILVVITAGTLFIAWYSISSHAEPSRLVAGFPSEFIERGDGYKGLKEIYHLNLDVREMEIGLMYQAIKNKHVDVISGFSTDGRIEAFNLYKLIDDKNYFPPYHAAPVIRRKTLNEYPEILTALSTLENMVSDEAMAQMNYQVDEEGKDIREVAINFLKSTGFHVGRARAGSPDVLIGSKNFTESFILAHIFKIIIESETGLTAGLKLGFGGTKLLFDALNTGEVDLYPEYTGTGLLVILKPEKDGSIPYEKDKVYNFVSKEFKERFDVVWLPPLGFNNTFALMMRKDQAEELKIKSISDLAGIRQE
ncbi:ABC transporter permease/substrate-binding protein [Fulvivirga ulvae]|uniref:ABC transporter permease/substrate-binding protein n=1 Tax=Fulvivirga ulvae TaxID=2904245 RepID=UPI001F1A4918|nr:ABC transporter permease/substrate-binding protein [Fulvivirga ulvae]UII34062.1 ABC transporter permease/substrate-binding protein [Fulvivirga ulvae]